MKQFSIYEAKARFSELVRRVRERGERITITYHGEPVAELRPLEQQTADGWPARAAELERSGVLQRRAPLRETLKPLARRQGALQRFLEDRGE